MDGRRVCGEWWGRCCVGQAAAAGRTGLAGSHRAGALQRRERVPGSGVEEGETPPLAKGKLVFKEISFPLPCCGPLVEGLMEKYLQWNFS